MKASYVYKVCSRQELQAAQQSGSYRGSSADVRDGFVHLSLAEQLPGTLAKHFAEQRDLVLLKVDAAALGGQLRYEVSRGGALFPHLYGALPLAAVCAVQQLPDDATERLSATQGLVNA